MFHSPQSDEWVMKNLLQAKLPFLKWEEGDSSWDKIRVWGQDAQTMIRVYRYESPGPFKLTIALEQQEGSEIEQSYLELRDKVLSALDGSLSKPL